MDTCWQNETILSKVRRWHRQREESDWVEINRGINFHLGLCIQTLFLGNRSPCPPLSPAVGNSVDRACKIEALLRNLAIQRKELRAEQSKVDNRFIRLMNQLQDSLENDEDLTVICGKTLADTALQAEPTRHIMEVSQATRSTRVQNESFEDHPRKPARLNTLLEEDSQALATQPSSPFICFTNPLFSCEGDKDGEENDENAAGIFSSLSSHSLLAPEREPSQYQLSAGARAWRERNLGDERINFRTGMSGHMGLVSSQSHSHAYLQSNRKMGKMSSHRGVSSSASPFWFLGALFSSPSQDERDMSSLRIHRADSV